MKNQIKKEKEVKGQTAATSSTVWTRAFPIDQFHQEQSQLPSGFSAPSVYRANIVLSCGIVFGGSFFFFNLIAFSSKGELLTPSPPLSAPSGLFVVLCNYLVFVATCSSRFFGFLGPTVGIFGFMHTCYSSLTLFQF